MIFAITLTYVLQSAYNLLDIVQMMAMLEQDMISVERVKAYTELEQEAAAIKVSDPPVERWPAQGAISFTDVQLRYRPELRLVLKGLTFDVKPGEKVGIIGRTGAGKSSLVQATYRTVELAGGSIAVDGVDLRSLGLHTVSHLRSAIWRVMGMKNINTDGSDAQSPVHHPARVLPICGYRPVGPPSVSLMNFPAVKIMDADKQPKHRSGRP